MTFRVSSFPAQVTSNAAYELSIYAPSSVANTYYLTVTNLGGGTGSAGATFSTVLTGSSTVVPQSTTLLAPSAYKTNNTTAGTVSFDIASIYIENQSTY